MGKIRRERDCSQRANDIVVSIHQDHLENGLRFCWLPPVGLVKAFVRDALRGPRDRLSLYLLAKRTFKNRFVLIWALPFLPLGKFLRMYVLKLGFRDGLRGLLVAALSAMYVVLKYAKYWEKRRSAEPDVLRDERGQSGGTRVE